jgi:hypothetical protein
MKENHKTINEPGVKTMFNVPDDYFVHFKADMAKHIDKLESAKTQTKSQNPNGSGRFVLNMDVVKPYLYIAALFVMILFSVSLIMNVSSNRSSSLGLSAGTNSQTSTSNVSTAEDYLINSVGTYGITEYYLDSETLE